MMGNQYSIDGRLLLRLTMVYGVACLIMYTGRLTSILHAESSAIVATVGFFASGLFVLREPSQSVSTQTAIRTSFVASIVPLFFLTLSLLWMPNCAYVQGLLIFLLFVPPSVLLGVALARAIDQYVSRWKILSFVLIGVFVAILPTVVTLKFFPQFYIYNHVFGGVLGPVYEDELSIRLGLVVYRLLTVLWALLLLGMASRKAMRTVRIANVIAILLIYLSSGFFGIHGSVSYLSNGLGTAYQTEHFKIHFSPSTYSDSEIKILGLYHEFQFQRLSKLLDVEPSKRVDVFIYPDSKSKSRLTGAGTTSVAPVWLPRPQIHILKSEVTRALDHELAHVFSREFGSAITNATTKIGLVEGLAVAVEKPDAQPDLHQQVRVLLTDSLFTMSYDDRRIERMIASPLFWLDRGAVAYSIAGSFIRWLITECPAENFREVYSSKSFESVYGVSLSELIRQWRAYILSLPIDEEALSIGEGRFSIPSLFEKHCPHHIPAHRKAYRTGRDAVEEMDWTLARTSFAEAIHLRPDYQQARAELAGLNVRMGDVHAAITAIGPVDSSTYLGSLLALGDAYLINSEYALADSVYLDIQTRVPEYFAAFKYRVALRQSIASSGIEIGNIFAVDASYAPRKDIPDSVGYLVNTIRGLEFARFDQKRAIESFETAREVASFENVGYVSAQLSALYFWTGQFEAAERSGLAGAEYYHERRNDALAAYYEYVAELSGWALQH